MIWEHKSQVFSGILHKYPCACIYSVLYRTNVSLDSESELEILKLAVLIYSSDIRLCLG